MAYSFWHCGILIGESDMDEPGGHPRQIGGAFRPTAYGLDLFPRLTGILTAGSALKDYLDARGLVAEDMERSEIRDVLETTPAGQKIIDIGRTLCDVEVRSPDGRPLEFASIAFSDMMELKELTAKIGGDELDECDDWPPDAPRYVVSATFVDPKRKKSVGRVKGFPFGHGASDN